MSARPALWRSLWPTLLFYSSSAVAVVWLEHLQPSGMCNAGAGVMAFLLLGGVSIGLLLLNIVRAMVNADLVRLGIATLHLLALVGVAALLNLS